MKKLENEVTKIEEGKEIKAKVKIIKNKEGLTELFVGELVNISDMNVENNTSTYTILLTSIGKLVDVEVDGNKDKIFFI